MGTDGYSFWYWAENSGLTPPSETIWLDDVQCAGTETDILACTHLALGSHNCGNYEDAGIACSGTPAGGCDGKPHSP